MSALGDWSVRGAFSGWCGKTYPVIPETLSTLGPPRIPHVAAPLKGAAIILLFIC